MVIIMLDISVYDPLDSAQDVCTGSCNVCQLFDNHFLCRPNFFMSPLDEYYSRLEIFFALPDC